MNRTHTLSLLMAVVLVGGLLVAVTQASSVAAAAGDSPEYVMDGTVETAESVSASVSDVEGFEEPPAFGLDDSDHDASPVSGSLAVGTAEAPKYLL